jgi:small GTP-binding protein
MPDGFGLFEGSPRVHPESVASPALCKVVMLGSTAVGKTAIIKRLVNNCFDDRHMATIGSSYSVKDTVSDGIPVRLQLWDTGGQEQFRAIAPIYYRNADAVLVVYDVSCQESFDAVGGWIADVRENGPAAIVIALIGNKKDLVDERVVAADAGAELAQKEELPVFEETSAKTGEGVENVVAEVVKILIGGKRQPDDVLHEKKDGGCRC